MLTECHWWNGRLYGAHPSPPPGTETGLNVKTETTEPSEEEQVKVETVAFLRHCCPVKMQSEPRVSFTVFSKVR